MTTRYCDMSDFELHTVVTTLANRASKAYAEDPNSAWTHIWTRYYEKAHAAWSLRQFITAANTLEPDRL